MEQFGMKGFTSSQAWMDSGTFYSGVGWPANISEAGERPVYGIWNLWKQSMPGQMYGSTAVVLRNSVVKDGVFTWPTDSGGWIQVCNRTWNKGNSPQRCSSIPTASSIPPSS